MGTKKFTVLSLFSGGMGFDIGLEQTARFKLLACVEKVPSFCQTIAPIATLAARATAT